MHVSKSQNYISNRSDILLIDNDQSINKLLERYIGEKGFSVNTCRNVTTGFDWLQSRNPKIVFCDVWTFFHLNRKIREDFRREVNKNKTYFYFTSTLPLEHLEVVLDFEIKEKIIAKPFDFKKINEILEIL